jgi:hypothetical protein
MAKKARGMPATNADELVEMAVLGTVCPPVSRGTWRVGADGVPAILPGVGGITYSCKVGDSALKWAADHVEPGVTVKAEKAGPNAALNTMACVGNEARVVGGGDAKGDKGIVTGTHGGVEHVLVDFPDKTLDKLAIGDRIQVRARGLGLRLRDMAHIVVMNMDPRLLAKMAPRRDGDVLRVRVSHLVPAAIMGSGLGSSHTYSGDYDIQMFDEKVVKEYGLADLRFGDIVAITDSDHTYGRIYLSGAVSVGVVIHSCCKTAGHGPGVTTLMSSRDGRLLPVLDPKANIANYLRIGRRRPKRRRRK